MTDSPINQHTDALRRSEWRPIESVPKEYVYVLLSSGGDQSPVIGFFSEYDYDGKPIFDDGDFRSCMTGFTHWMPLPEPPK